MMATHRRDRRPPKSKTHVGLIHQASLHEPLRHITVAAATDPKVRPAERRSPLGWRASAQVAGPGLAGALMRSHVMLAACPIRSGCHAAVVARPLSAAAAR